MARATRLRPQPRLAIGEERGPAPKAPTARTAVPAHRRTVELVHHARIPRPLKLILVSSRGCPPREEAGGMRWVAITVTASPAANVVHSPSDVALTSSFPKACGALSSLFAALIKSPSYWSSLVQAKCAESVCLVGAAARGARAEQRQGEHRNCESRHAHGRRACQGVAQSLGPRPRCRNPIDSSLWLLASSVWRASTRRPRWAGELVRRRFLPLSLSSNYCTRMIGCRSLTELSGERYQWVTSDPLRLLRFHRFR